MTLATPTTGTSASGPVIDPVRAAYSARIRRRSTWVGVTSTVVFLVVAGALITRAPGWPAVKHFFFDPQAAKAAFPGLIRAFWLNVRMFLVAEPCILVLALVIAVVRQLRTPVLAPLRLVAAVYTDVVRGIPTLLLVALFGFGIPALGISWLPPEAVVWGTVALIVSYSAYVAEVFRAGISSVHPSQRAAARSLGLSTWQTQRYVVVPQAVRRVLPPLLNDFISLQKDTALVSFLGPLEILRVAQIDASYTFNYTPYVVAAAIFVALTIPMARLADWVTARTNARQQGSVGVS